MGIWTRVLTSLTQRKQMMMAMVRMPVILIDNDGVDDVDDNRPMAVNPEQEDSFGDARGDACEDVYFIDGFENGLFQWTICRGGWTTSPSAAINGEYGLVEAEGLPPTRQHLIETVPFDPTDARQPRIYFDGRFDLIRNGFRVKVFSGDEALLDTLLLGPGHTGRVARAYEIPLDDAVGLDDVRVRLECWTHNSVGHGVWIDNFRVDERPTLPPHVLPFSDDFDDLAHWGQFNGVWTTTRNGWRSDLQRISRLKAARFRDSCRRSSRAST